MYDYLIAGSGLYRATVAKQLKDAGKSVLVIDKRPNVAGNVYIEKMEGIFAKIWSQQQLIKILSILYITFFFI